MKSAVKILCSYCGRPARVTLAELKRQTGECGNCGYGLWPDCWPGEALTGGLPIHPVCLLHDRLELNRTGLKPVPKAELRKMGAPPPKGSRPRKNCRCGRPLFFQAVHRVGTWFCHEDGTFPCNAPFPAASVMER